jgi:hypothetical protein
MPEELSGFGREIFSESGVLMKTAEEFHAREWLAAF